MSATRQPRAPKQTAMARPTPALAPVTTSIFECIILSQDRDPSLSHVSGMAGVILAVH